MTGRELHRLMMASYVHVRGEPNKEWVTGYAELTVVVVARHWNGSLYKMKGLPEFTEELFPEGKTVKVVMASRFGDLGITDNLNAQNGYCVRVLPEMLSNVRLTKKVEK